MKTFAKAIASLVNYSSGPKSGSPNKLIPGTTIETEGTQPGSGAKISAEEHNYLNNNLQKRTNALQLAKLRNFRRYATLFDTQKPPMRVGVDPLDGMCLAAFPNNSGNVNQLYVIDCVSTAENVFQVTDSITGLSDTSTTTHAGESCFYVPVDDVNGTGIEGLYYARRASETAVSISYVTNSHGADTPSSTLIGSETISSGDALTYGIKAGSNAIFAIHNTSFISITHLYTINSGASPTITQATTPGTVFGSSPNFRANNVLAYNPTSDRAVYVYYDVDGAGEIRASYSDNQGSTWQLTNLIVAGGSLVPYDVQYVPEYGENKTNVFMLLAGSGSADTGWEIWTSEDAITWTQDLAFDAPSNYKGSNCAILLGDVFMCLTGSSGRGIYVRDLVSGKEGVFNVGKLGETTDGTARITTDHDRNLVCLSRADLEDSTTASFAVNMLGSTGGFEL